MNVTEPMNDIMKQGSMTREEWLKLKGIVENANLGAFQNLSDELKTKIFHNIIQYTKVLATVKSFQPDVIHTSVGATVTPYPNLEETVGENLGTESMILVDRSRAIATRPQIPKSSHINNDKKSRDSSDSPSQKDPGKTPPPKESEEQSDDGFTYEDFADLLKKAYSVVTNNKIVDDYEHIDDFIRKVLKRVPKEFRRGVGEALQLIDRKTLNALSLFFEMGETKAHKVFEALFGWSVIKWAGASDDFIKIIDTRGAS